MLRRRVIPCLDVANGRVVKGVQFKNLTDAGDPIAMASRYADDGADEVCYLDITASIEGRGLLLDLVRRTAEQVFVPLTVGGGVRGADDMRATLRAGADKVTVNSAAIDRPEMLRDCAESFGRQCVVLAIDAKRRGERWEVYTHGGTRATGTDAVAWAEMGSSLGAGEILLTSMDRDGTKAGYDLPLLEAVRSAVDVPIIASGGAGVPQHLTDALGEGRADAVLAASIFHRAEHSVKAVKKALATDGIPVRQVPNTADTP